MTASKSVIYVAGPYTSSRPARRYLNIREAVSFGQIVRQLGFIPVVPHVAVLPVENTEAGYEQAMEECFELMSRCDAVALMPTWHQSAGAKRERAFAEHLGIPVFETLGDLQEAAHAIE